MDGFSSHTYSLINTKNELFYVKWHFKTKQGIKNFTGEEADAMRGEDPDYAQRDLFGAIKNGDFPKWRVCMQIMPEAEAETYHINPFDLTKVWPHGGDNRPTLRNSLVSGDPDLARGSEEFYYSSAGFLTVWRGQPSSQ